MGCMRAEWYETDYWYVETSQSTEIVPCDVESNPDKLDVYVTGDIWGEPERKHGWIGRLSAPGYSDCTDWIAADTEADIKAELADMHDLCPEHMCELDEKYECPECRAELTES